MSAPVLPSTLQEQTMNTGIDLIKQGCAMIETMDGGSNEEKRLKSAITLLIEAATIIKSVPDAGQSSMLRWRLYQTIQAQEGGDDAALYKELRCSIHLGLAGECSDPVTLPCGHSFCKTCLGPLYLQSAAQRKCPQCRTLITVSYDSLKQNVALNGITQHLLPMGTQRDEAAIATMDARVRAATLSHYGGGGLVYYYDH